MKKRNGFVTNSSSTSYVCEITGHKEVFHDSEDHRDYGYYRCDNEHVFLQEFLLDVEERYPSAEEMKTYLREFYNNRIKYASISDAKSYKYRLSYIESCSDEELREEYVDNVDFDGDVREYQCPICQMEVLSQNDLSRYLVKKYGVSEQEAFDDVKKSNKRRKKLYEGEYINYVYTKLGLTEDVVFDQIKTKFENYNNFKAYLRS